VNHQFLSLLATSIANERAAEADRYWRWAAHEAFDDPSPSLLRRSLARGIASVSRGSAWVVRRLDSCVADDLGRSLAPTK